MLTRSLERHNPTSVIAVISRRALHLAGLGGDAFNRKERKTMTQLIQGFQVSEYTGQTSMPRNLGVEDRIEYLEERIRDYQEAIKTWKEYGTGHTVLLPTDKWRMQVVGNDGRFDAKEGELLLIVTMADANKFVQHLVIPFSEFSQNLVSADDLKRMVSDFIATPSVSDGVEKIR